MVRLWCFFISLCSGGSPEVQAPAGTLRGITEGLAEEVHVFRGIPYAEAPVGSLRWRPPVAKKKWPGVLDASSYGNSCLNHFATSDWKDVSTKKGHEDCLFLNVYAPKEANASSQLPCFLWIHGGAFEFGSSSEYNGSSLVSFLRSRQSLALVVTLNYRLNIFGFLGSDQLRDRDVSRSTGNYGLQDQRMALQWVQDNIGAFGGDPSRVLLWGQSGGAAAVSVHLVAPKSYGLYSRALMQSGAFAPWASQPMRRKEFWFHQLLNHTGCKNVDCLVSTDAEELLLAYMAIPDGQCCGRMAVPGGNPELPWAPTIDGVELTAHPWELLKQGKVNQVPMLLGSNLDDGARFCEVPHNLSTKDFLTLFQVNHRISSPGPAELYRSESHILVPGYGEGYWSAQRVVGDHHHFCPVHMAVRLVSSPVYVYMFAHSLDGPIVTHSVDLPFVFMELPQTASSEEHHLAVEVVMRWYSFAALGHPGHSWPAWSAKDSPMLKFQVESKGGIHVIDGSYRDAKCSFSNQWMQRYIGDHSDFQQPAANHLPWAVSEPVTE